MSSATSAYRTLRRDHPILTQLLIAATLGFGATVLRQVFQQNADVLAPWQVGCLVSGGYLFLVDGLEAAEIEAHRRGDRTGRWIRSAAMGLFWFALMFVVNSSVNGLRDLVIWAAAGVLFAVIVGRSSRSKTSYPLADLRAEFIDPDTAPDPRRVWGAVLIPVVGVALAIWDISTRPAPRPFTYFVVLFCVGAVVLHPRVPWRIYPRFAGIVLLCIPLGL